MTHIQTAIIATVLRHARDVRDSAKIRTEMGLSVGDNAFSDAIWSAAKELSAALRARHHVSVPASSLTAYLWRAARVGEASYRSGC